MDKSDVIFELERVTTEASVCVEILRPVAEVLLAVVIAVLCFTGNSLVIVIYSRSKQIVESKIFELAFAILDTSACVFLLPLHFIAASSFGICSNELVIQFVNFSNVVVGPAAFTAYYSLLVCVAIDRFCAVFYPLKFKIMRKHYIRKMLAIVGAYVFLTVFALKVLVINPEVGLLVRIVSSFLSILAIVVIAILFTAIVVRIRRHSAQMVSGTVL